MTNLTKWQTRRRRAIAVLIALFCLVFSFAVVPITIRAFAENSGEVVGDGSDVGGDLSPDDTTGGETSPEEGGTEGETPTEPTEPEITYTEVAVADFNVAFDVSYGDILISGQSGYATGYGEDGVPYKVALQTSYTNDYINVFTVTGTTEEYGITLGTGTLVDSNGTEVEGISNITLYLDNVNVNLANVDNKAALYVAGHINRVIHLVPKNGTTNTFKSGRGRAGIEKAAGSLTTMRFTCETGYNGSGTGNFIRSHQDCSFPSCGKVVAEGGDTFLHVNRNNLILCGAGIGSAGGGDINLESHLTYGNYDMYLETEEEIRALVKINTILDNLIISGGVIEATGGRDFNSTAGAAGIGGGSAAMTIAQTSNNRIQIVGGHVTAVRGSYSASCIGGGYRSGDSRVVIRGGTVIATDTRDEANNELYYQDLTAINQEYGPRGSGIGGGGGGQGTGATGTTIVYIEGGNITAKSGCGAAIGSGAGGNGTIYGTSNGMNADVTITGNAVVRATTTSVGAAIGAGGSMMREAYEDSNPIGEGKGGTATISLSGTINVTAYSEGGADIGGGGTKSQILVTDTNGTIQRAGTGGNATITINGGTITTQNGGIGGGHANKAKGGNATITITGGTITTPNIGGGDSTDYDGGNLTKLTISNGTLIVNDTIGGGNSIHRNGGSANLEVQGGKLQALSIGGGKSENGGIGGEATLTVTGGTLIADSIGGGSAVAGTGGKAKVTVTGGILNATDIGGGSAISGTGGEGIVIVEGGRFTVTNSIGGGNSQTGYGGSATATISGGTVVAGTIGGGFSSKHGFSTNTTITVTGGSLDTMMTAQPTNGSVEVFQTTVTFYEYDKRILPNALVTSLTLEPPFDYGKKDMYSNSTAMLYLWLPNGETITNILVQEDGQNTTTEFTGNITAGSAGVLKKDSPKNYFNVLFSYDDRYTITYDPEGTVPIKGVWAAARGESLNFYVHPKLDANGIPYAITAFRSENVSHSFEEFEADSTSTNVRYYFKLTVTSDMELLFATKDSNNHSRLSLDLAQSPVVLREDGVAVGGYLLLKSNYNGSFMLTSGGLPTENTVRVVSGEHDVYVHYLTALSEQSILSIEGGTLRLTASEVNNSIASANGTSPLYVHEGGTLMISISGSSSLNLISASTNFSIGGSGNVIINKDDGFLNMETQGTQISAKSFTFNGPVGEAMNIPYTLHLVEGNLVGFNNGSILQPNGSLTASDASNPNFTAFGITFINPNNYTVNYSIDESGNLFIELSNGQVSKILLDGVELENGYTTDETGTTVSGLYCKGNSIVVIVSDSQISYHAPDVQTVYNGNNQSYPVIVTSSGTVEYSTTGTDGSWTTTAPAWTDVGTYTVHYRITSGSTVITNSAIMTITKGTNAWDLQLTCGSILQGEMPGPHAEPKWSTSIRYPYYKVVDGQPSPLGLDEVPSDAGLYAVKAVAAETSNFDALESELIYFTIDASVVYLAVGKDYNHGFDGLEGDATVQLDEKKNFTVYYGTTYIPDANKPLQFTFSTPLPEGTILTVLNFVNGRMQPYYYRVIGGSISSITSNDFIRMGTSATKGFEDTSTNEQRQLTLKLCVQLPTTFDSNFTIALHKQGESDFIASDVQVNMPTTDAVHGSIAIQSPTANSGKIEMSVSVTDAEGGENAIAVELYDSSNNAVSYPTGSNVVLIQNGVERTPVRIAGNVAFFEKISSGTYVLKFDMENGSIVGSKTFKVKVSLCENPYSAAYAMQSQVSNATSAAIAVQPFVPVAIKATAPDRVIDVSEKDALTITVERIGTVSANTSLTYTVMKKSNGDYVADSLTLTQTGSPTTVNGKTTVTYTANVTKNTPSGSYCVDFTYGDATYRFTFIVK